MATWDLCKYSDQSSIARKEHNRREAARLQRLGEVRSVVKTRRRPRPCGASVSSLAPASEPRLGLSRQTGSEPRLRTPAVDNIFLLWRPTNASASSQKTADLSASSRPHKVQRKCLETSASSSALLSGQKTSASSPALIPLQEMSNAFGTKSTLNFVRRDELPKPLESPPPARLKRSLPRVGSESRSGSSAVLHAAKELPKASMEHGSQRAFPRKQGTSMAAGRDLHSKSPTDVAPSAASPVEDASVTEDIAPVRESSSTKADQQSVSKPPATPQQLEKCEPAALPVKDDKLESRSPMSQPDQGGKGGAVELHSTADTENHRASSSRMPSRTTDSESPGLAAHPEDSDVDSAVICANPSGADKKCCEERNANDRQILVLEAALDVVKETSERGKSGSSEQFSSCSQHDVAERGDSSSSTGGRLSSKVDAAERGRSSSSEPARAEACQEASCPSCGNVYMPDAVFCRQCGKRRQLIQTEATTEGTHGPGHSENTESTETSRSPPGSNLPSDKADKARDDMSQAHSDEPLDEPVADCDEPVNEAVADSDEPGDELVADCDEPVADPVANPASHSPGRECPDDEALTNHDSRCASSAGKANLLCTVPENAMTTDSLAKQRLQVDVVVHSPRGSVCVSLMPEDMGATADVWSEDRSRAASAATGSSSGTSMHEAYVEDPVHQRSVDVEEEDEEGSYEDDFEEFYEDDFESFDASMSL